jgi:hypothetical protein|tara:strand:- start:669 stop:1124 length:456 start_codon:yes stop_codon:yes gene_type:complete
MKGFYNVTETIKNQLLSDVNVNTVTMGDITKVDLSKQTLFPLSHMIVNSVTNEDSILRYNISILSMDIVDISKDEVVDLFIGNNNEQDVLNTQLVVLNKLVQVLRGGDLYTSMYQLDGSPSFEPFMDRFENEVAGWTLSLDVIVPNDITIC